MIHDLRTMQKLELPQWRLTGEPSQRLNPLCGQRSEAEEVLPKQ